MRTIAERLGLRDLRILLRKTRLNWSCRTHSSSDLLDFRSRFAGALVLAVGLGLGAGELARADWEQRPSSAAHSAAHDDIALCEAASGRSHLFSDGDDFETRVFETDSGVLCVDGGVTDAFADWYVDQADAFDVVVIRSLGGRGAAGVRTGEAALAAQVQVVVWDYCISACANGLVIGASSVIVPEPAILAWHGSLPRDQFEAILLSRGGSPKLRRVQEQVLAAFENTGDRIVSGAQWAAVPDDERTVYAERSLWRSRVQALLDAKGVEPDFLAASAFAARHAPEETQAMAIARAGSLAPILWVPTRDQLQRWGLGHIQTWDPASPEALYALGLSMSPAMALTSVELEPGEFYALGPTPA